MFYTTNASCYTIHIYSIRYLLTAYIMYTTGLIKDDCHDIVVR